jgi:hypothetical protein
VTAPRPLQGLAEPPIGEFEQPEWCIDRAGVIEPMTNAAFRAALAAGALPPKARAWRLGMECWAPVSTIAELADARPKIVPELPVTLPPAAWLEGLGPETLDALDLRESLFNAEAKTPAPAPGTRERTVGVASAPTRPALRPLAAVRRALTPLTLGSAIGAAAIAVAVVTVMAPVPSAERLPRAHPVMPLVSNAASRAVELARNAPASAGAGRVDAPSSPPLARADRKPARDPGQRRLRTGARP